MKNKGQVIIEFLLLIFVIMVYVSSTLLPQAETISNSLYDASNISKIDIQAKRFDRTVNQMSHHSSSTYYMVFYVPNDTNFFCLDANHFAYTVRMSSEENPKPCITSSSNTPSNPTESCCYSYLGNLYCSKIFYNTHIYNCSSSSLNIVGPFSGRLFLETLSSGDVNVTLQSS